MSKGACFYIMNSRFEFGLHSYVAFWSLWKEAWANLSRDLHMIQTCGEYHHPAVGNCSSKQVNLEAILQKRKKSITMRVNGCITLAPRWWLELTTNQIRQLRTAIARDNILNWTPCATANPNTSSPESLGRGFWFKNFISLLGHRDFLTCLNSIYNNQTLNLQYSRT